MMTFVLQSSLALFFPSSSSCSLERQVFITYLIHFVSLNIIQKYNLGKNDCYLHCVQIAVIYLKMRRLFFHHKYKIPLNFTAYWL